MFKKKEKLKSPGFYTPMDLVPDEYGSTVDYKTLRAGILAVIEEDWGPRCKTKDTDDFDDLITVGDPDAGRCPVCLVYEKFDAFWKVLDFEKQVEVS